MYSPYRQGKMMRAIVVGTGAGGATVARELTAQGFKVIILEAGKKFRPFRQLLSLAAPLRKTGIFGNEKIISHIFPPMNTIHSSNELVLIRGITSGGSTVLSCGNIVRTEHGLKEIGLDLTPEFEEIEKDIGVTEFPRKKWRPITRKCSRLQRNSD